MNTGCDLCPIAPLGVLMSFTFVFFGANVFRSGISIILFLESMVILRKKNKR